MATFTITDAQNIDALTTKAGADTYNVNGGYLTIDQNTLFGQNIGTAGGMGNITISAALGGTVDIDARYVRQIPYDGGSGNVPAYNTTISDGTGSGKLIGVVATLQSSPTLPASAMPATGFILIKQWNSLAFTDNTALTGITATVNGTDAAACMFVVGNENASRVITCVRLGKFYARGAWYEIGTTTGTSTTNYSYPTYGQSNLMLPGVWVETGTSTDVYEFYPCDRRVAAANQLGTEEARGKFCYNNTTTASATFRLGNDGTNNNGYVPPSGRRIRIPNLWLVNTTASTVASPTTTIATRPEFATTGGGDLEFDKVISHWYMNFSQAYAVKLDNVATEAIVLSECATAIDWSNVCTGGLTTTVQNPITMSLDFVGGTLDDCVFGRYSLVATTILNMTDCSGFTFTNCKFVCPSNRSGTAVPILFTRVKNSTLTGCTMQGGSFTMTTCDDITVTNLVYIDRAVASLTPNNPVYAFIVQTASQNIKIDGFTVPVALNGPYNGILSLAAAGCKNIKIRNIGTSGSPLELGAGSPTQYSWTRSTTTATVTWTSHGMAVGEAFHVLLSSSTGAIGNATTYTVVGVTDANTFTFTCLNGGSASGTIVAYRTSCAGLGLFATGGAAENVKIQRVYLKNTRRNFIGPDNSNKTILYENCDFEASTPLINQGLDQRTKNVVARPVITSNAALYGTHWVDGPLSTASSQTTASWSRTTTTATFTVSGHSLIVGDEILITNSNSIAAIPNGRYAITTLGTTNTFTITCLNAGNASGTADYTVVRGRIAVLMNEATAASVANYTIDAGTPKFTSGGALVLAAVNDQITWETPDYIKNYNAFPIHEPTLAGTSITLSNHEATYAIDGGSGYGAFKQLMFPRAGGGGSSSSTNVTMTSTTGVVVGSYVFGTGIAYGATVSSITNGTTIVVSIANTATVSGILRFSELPGETIASTGFKMKIRLKTVSAAASTSFSSISVNAIPSGTNEYTLDFANVSLSGLVTGSRVKATKVSNGDLLYNGAESAGSVSFETDYIGAVNLEARKASSAPYYKPFVTQVTTVSDTTVSAVALQVED